jgi:hypothetical protein
MNENSLENECYASSEDEAVIVLNKPINALKNHKKDGLRGNGRSWSIIVGTCDDKQEAKNMASNHMQFTIKGGVLNCTYHKHCLVKRKVVQVGRDFVVKQTSDIHTTELLPYSYGFPKLIRDLVDHWLERGFTPLRLCAKLEDCLKQSGYEEHLKAFQLLLLTPEEGAYRRVQLMIQSRAVTLKKWNMGPNEIVFRCALEDFLTQFEVC